MLVRPLRIYGPLVILGGGKEIVLSHRNGRHNPGGRALLRRLRRRSLRRTSVVVFSGDGTVPLRHSPELQEEVAGEALRVVADFTLIQKQDDFLSRKL